LAPTLLKTVYRGLCFEPSLPREDWWRRTKAELYERIRREYEHGGGTIRGIARKFGIPWRMVREAVISAVPVNAKCRKERDRS